MQQIDEAILLFIREHLVSDPVTVFLGLFTNLGDAGLLWIIIGILLLRYASTRKGALVYFISLGSAAAVCNLVIKPIVGRARPYETIAGFEPLVEPLSSFSFPSGHACSSFAAAAALVMIFGKKAAWAFVPAAIIAISRPYLGVHYVSDVVCGALFGAAVSAAVVLIFRKKTGFLEAGRDA